DIERKQATARFDGQFAEYRVRGLFNGGRKRCVVERSKRVRRAGIEHPDKTRAVAGQGNERERPVRGVEFGRCIVMRARMGEAQRQRDLRIAALVERYAGGGAAY